MKIWEVVAIDQFYKVLGKGFFATVVFGTLLVFFRVISIVLVWLGAKIIEWIFGGYIIQGIHMFWPGLNVSPAMIPAAAVILYVLFSFIATPFREQVTKNNN